MLKRKTKNRDQPMQRSISAECARAKRDQVEKEMKGGKKI